MKLKFLLPCFFILIVLLTLVMTAFYPEQQTNNFDWSEKVKVNLKNPESEKDIIKSGTQKTIRWKNNAPFEKQNYAFIFLHGFTGFTGELSPLIEKIQDELPANLYYQRISGHGYPNGTIEKTQIKDWFKDIREAHAYAEEIGHQKVYFAISTGAGMSLLLTKQFQDSKSCLIFFSPNFGLKNKISLLGTGLLGDVFIKSLIGDSFVMPTTDSNELKSPIIKSESIKEFLEMTKIFRNMDLADLKNPLLIFYSSKDNVVDPAQIARKFNSIHMSSKNQLHNIGNGHLLYNWNDESKTNEVKEIIKKFILQNCQE